MERGALLSVCLIWVSIRTFLGQSESGPVVTLTTGRVRGQLWHMDGSTHSLGQYLGIPFARPPLGPLRLAAPLPADPWEGVRDATRPPPMCVQDVTVIESAMKTMPMELSIPAISEDCLYLNIYAPTEVPSGERLPVMVWIHGGGLAVGGTFQYDGSALASNQNVVVVIIQYRLGILGFLSTGDEHSRGNWGLLDQIAALQWVQENIECFGGDPHSVTIFGQSAGGISVSMLMVASLTECDDSTAEKIVQCIKGKSEEDMINAAKKLPVFLGPAIDGVFLKGPPEDVLKSKDFLKIPVLIGVTNHEFGWYLAKAFAPPSWENGMEKQMVTSVLDLFYPSMASGGNELIADEYLRDAQTPEDIRDGYTEILGDMVLVLPMLKVAGYHRDAGVPVYFYEFQHQPTMYQDTRPSFVQADHADDAWFVLGACFWNGDVRITGPISEEEEKLCRTLMAYWANFARTGSPNGPGLVEWPPYDITESYMNLGMEQRGGHRLKQNRAHFLNVVLPEKLSHHRIANEEL